MLISGNPSEALTTAISIEHENNPLTNSFDKKPQKKSILTAFDDVSEQIPQVEYEMPTNQTNEPINTQMNTDLMSDDEIDLLMQEESKKMTDNVPPPSENLFDTIDPLDMFQEEDY